MDQKIDAIPKDRLKIEHKILIADTRKLINQSDFKPIYDSIGGEGKAVIEQTVQKVWNLNRNSFCDSDNRANGTILALLAQYTGCPELWTPDRIVGEFKRALADSNWNGGVI